MLQIEIMISHDFKGFMGWNLRAWSSFQALKIHWLIKNLKQKIRDFNILLFASNIF